MDGFRELPVGKTLYNGTYIIEKVLGAGGFGITYYARHKTLHQYYAVKEFFISGRCVRNTQTKKIHLQGISKEEYDDYKRKFMDEAKTLSKLEHPNIVEVNNYFEENDTAYMVMKFVKGINLQQLITQNGKLDYEIAVNYIAQISEAVDYIHERDILHRDIKPDNVIITSDHKAILIDFGSAREFVHDRIQSHTVMLTKGYAPPEQYSDVSKKGSYSDIYSLGAVFYFMLTAQKPVDSSARTIEILPQPKDLLPSVSENANHTIMKAMSLKPEERYQSIEEFMDDLLGEKTGNRKTKAKKKNSKLLWTGIAALLLLLVSGAVYYFKFTGTTNVLKEELQQPSLNHSPEKEQNIGLTDSSEEQSLQDTEVQEETIKQEQLKYEEAKTQKVVPKGLIRPTEDEQKIREGEKSGEKTNPEEINEEDEIFPAQREQQMREEQIKETLRKASEAFNMSDYENAFNLYKQAKDLGSNDNTGCNNFLKKANTAFNAPDYENAFDLYKKVKVLNPGDVTGYNNFIKKAKTMIEASGYDSIVKKLLLKAKELKNTDEVNNLLSKCN